MSGGLSIGLNRVLGRVSEIQGVVLIGGRRGVGIAADEVELMGHGVRCLGVAAIEGGGNGDLGVGSDGLWGERLGMGLYA
ncbi:hypothetical protein PIB30_089130 [Stylosanthes scabra]|uniref:Uncharacterized protein n=1 Tax=Stylosanthes scabra TaxID=79078 RepID=A0ABU6TTD5_9FABA|nr:hypothetical protein [Stylosanthes scabra]